MVLGDAVSKLETFVWILNQISRSITSSLFTLKASNLVKWPISTSSFMWLCHFIDWLKFETRPSSLLNFGTAYYLLQVHSLIWVIRQCKCTYHILTLSNIILLTTALQSGGWVSESSRSFHHQQPAPRWRSLRWPMPGKSRQPSHEPQCVREKAGTCHPDKIVSGKRREDQGMGNNLWAESLA